MMSFKKDNDTIDLNQLYSLLQLMIDNNKLAALVAAKGLRDQAHNLYRQLVELHAEIEDIPAPVDKPTRDEILALDDRLKKKKDYFTLKKSISKAIRSADSLLRKLSDGTE